MIKCPSCQIGLVEPDIGKTVNCSCGQLVFNHPAVGGYKGYFIGLYKTCQKCQTFITGPVSFSQHFHDQCYPHNKVLMQKDKVIIVHELGVQ